MKFKPDEKFSRDTGITILADESFRPNYLNLKRLLLLRKILPLRSPIGIINLTGDIFGDDYN